MTRPESQSRESNVKGRKLKVESQDPPQRAIPSVTTLYRERSTLGSSQITSHQSRVTSHLRLTWFNLVLKLIMCQFPRLGNHLRGAGQKIFLELRRVWHGRIERGHAPDRPIEILEGALDDHGRDFASDSAGARVFVHHQQLVRFPDGGENRFAVERQERAQVDHFGVYAFFFEFRRGFERRVQHGRVAYDREVAPLAPHHSFPDRHRELALLYILLDPPVQEFVLE